jgi:hypothetical protein
MKAFTKLTEVVDGKRRIAGDPPLIVPIEDVASGIEPAELEEFLRGVIRSAGPSVAADIARRGADVDDPTPRPLVPPRRSRA